MYLVGTDNGEEMMRAVTIGWQLRGFALVAGVIAALSCASAASADRMGELNQRFEEATAVRNQAARTANEAAQAYDLGDYGRACQLFTESVEQWGDTDRALARAIEAGYGITAVDSPELALKIDERVADFHRGMNAAVAAKSLACKARDSGGGQAASMAASGPPRGNAAYTYQARELQDLVARSANYAQDAARNYEANDFAGACASSRLAAEGFGRVVRDLNANPQLESAFANSAQLYENAKAAAADRDEFYCKSRG